MGGIDLFHIDFHMARNNRPAMLLCTFWVVCYPHYTEMHFRSIVSTHVEINAKKVYYPEFSKIVQKFRSVK